MTQQNRTWLWLIGCGVGLMGMMTCLVVFAAAALIIIQREESPTPIAEELLVAPDAPAIESVIPDAPLITPDPTLTVNRIVYIDRDGQIVTIAPDGTETRQLTDDDDLRFQFPAWSPDGLQVAAIGSSRRDGGLFVLDDAAAAAPVELYRSSSNYPIYLYWSPTGQQVSFLAGHPQDGAGFHLANADGSTTDSLLTTGSPFYWNWLNDGLNLFIHSGLTGEGSRLGFMDNQGNTETTNLAEPGFFQSPGLSADGRYLAYGTLRDNQRRLIIADQQNGSEVSVQHQGFVALGWSPANDQLAFTSPLNPSDLAFGPLRLMDATTGDVTLLDSGPVFSFFWSPNGQAIAYLTLPSESLEDSADEGSKGVLARPQNQPDDFLLELRVVQVATGQRRVLLQFSPTNLFINQFLPFFDQYALSHRLWSPASDALVLPMLNDDGDPHIMIIRLDGSLPQPLAEGVMAFWSQQ
jgi:TolB protein